MKKEDAPSRWRSSFCLAPISKWKIKKKHSLLLKLFLCRKKLELFWNYFRSCPKDGKRWSNKMNNILFNKVFVSHKKFVFHLHTKEKKYIFLLSIITRFSCPLFLALSSKTKETNFRFLQMESSTTIIIWQQLGEANSVWNAKSVTNGRKLGLAADYEHLLRVCSTFSTRQSPIFPASIFPPPPPTLCPN